VNVQASAPIHRRKSKRAAWIRILADILCLCILHTGIGQPLLTRCRIPSRSA